nr:PREDICTED: uncharacterized protein LOC109035644 [Bemisia tabaci]
MQDQTDKKGGACKEFSAEDVSSEEDSSYEDSFDDDCFEDSSDEDMSDEDLPQELRDLGSSSRADLLAKATESKIQLIKSRIQAGEDLNTKMEGGMTLIFCAIAMKNIPLIEEMVSHGADLNIRADDGSTPLSAAIQSRRFDMVSRLLDLGADIQLRISDLHPEDTYLHRAASCGCVDMIILFIEKGIDVNVRNGYAETPLHSAVRFGEAEAVSALLVNGADVNAGACSVFKELPPDERKLGSNVTPIFLAAMFNEPSIVKILIEAGADVNATTSKMYTSLHPAAQEGYLDIVRMLLERKIDVNVRSEVDRTALSLAARSGHVEIVKALMDVEDIDLNPESFFGDTPLVSAAIFGHMEIAKLLIAKGVSINASGPELHCSPLKSAIIHGRKEMAEWLVSNGAKCQNSDLPLLTLDFQIPLVLHLAARNGWARVVESLILDSLIDVNELTDDGETALLLATSSGHLEVVTILLKNGADPNMADKKGQTPIWTAANRGDDKMIEQLMMHGANVNVVYGKKKETPLFSMVRMNNIPMATLILKGVVNINLQNSKTLAALHIAAGKGYCEMTELLLKYSADVNVKTKEGYTPLFLAVELKHPDTAQILLKHGANVNLACCSGVMPIHSAACELNRDMVKLLLQYGAYYNKEAKALNCCGTPLRFAHEGKDTELMAVYELIKKLLNASSKVDVEGIKSCLEAGAIVNARNAEGMTALHYAVSCSNIDATNLLLEYNADVELETNKGNRPLDIAVAKNNQELVGILLRHSEKLDFRKRNRIVNAKTLEGMTALHIAAEKNCVHIVQLLLGNGAVYNIKNNAGMTPLSLTKNEVIQKILLSVEKFFEAVESGVDHLTDASQMLEGNESILNARDCKGGGTLLYWSSAKGLTAIAEFLLDRGVDCSLVTNKGTLPLHIAVSKGHTKIVRAILNKVASNDPKKAAELVNTATSAGTAPLHLVSNTEIACCLLQHGAVYTVQNKENKSTLELTQDENVQKLLQTTHQLFQDTIKSDLAVMSVLDSLSLDEFKAVAGACNEKGQTLLQHFVVNDHAELASNIQEKIDKFITMSPGRSRNKIPSSQSAEGRALLRRKILSLIRSGGDLNQVVSREGDTPLLCAVLWGDLGLVEELVKSGADINKRATDIETSPLALSVSRKELAIFNCLLNHGADIQTKAVNGASVLHLAIQNNFLDVIELILDRGVDVNVQNDQEETPLHYAAMFSIAKIARLLLAKGAIINAKGHMDYGLYDGKSSPITKNVTPLYYAATFDNTEVANVLIKAGADVNACTSHGWTPLISAAQGGYSEMVRMLLRANADVNAKTIEGQQAAIHLAAKEGKRETVETLLSVEGIETNSASALGFTPLSLAIHYNRPEIAELLISKGKAPVDNQTGPHHSWMTTLQLAYELGNEDTAELLIRNGADLTGKGCCAEYFKPLHEAVERGWTRVVECLASKVDVDEISDIRTCLTEGIYQGNKHIVEILLRNGANPDLEDNDFDTPLDKAIASEQEDIFELLVKYGAHVISGDKYSKKYQKKFLLHAVSNNRIEVVISLLRLGVNVNCKNRAGETPLHIAVESKFQLLATKLLELGADVNAPNKSGVLPIQVAVQAGDRNMVKILLSHGAYCNVSSEAAKGSVFGMTATDTTVIETLELCNKLINSVAKNNYQQTEECIQAGVILNARDADGATALLKAVQSKSIDTVNLLLKHNADVELGTKSGNPLLIAVANGDEKLTHILLEYIKKQNFIKQNFILNATHPMVKQLYMRYVLNLLDRLKVDEFKAVAGAQNKSGQSLLKEKTLLTTMLGKLDQELRNKATGTKQLSRKKAAEVRKIMRKEILRKIKSGCNLSQEFPGCEGATPIHFAAMWKDLPLIQAIVQSGVDINLRSHNEEVTPLEVSMALDDLSFTNSLLNMGADINSRNSRGDSVLHAAAEGGTARIASFLISKGLDVNVQNFQGETPLHLAAKFNNASVAKVLLAKGANVNAGAHVISDYSEFGMKRSETKVDIGSNITPLYWAASCRADDVAKILIEAGADVNAQSSLKYTPLHNAAQSGSMPTLQMLLKANANVNVKSTQTGRTPLHLAAQNGETKAVEALLNIEGIEINPVANGGDTPLMLAILKNHLDIVKLLIGKGTHIDDLGGHPYFHTPLQEAFLHDKGDIAEWLIKNGADVKAKGCCAASFKPLHEAVENEWVGVVECLAPKINVNSRSSSGGTPLLKAVLQGHRRIVEILLRNGANPNKTDDKNRTPLFVAAVGNQDKIIELLVEHGGHVNTVCGDGKKTPLFYATSTNNMSLALLLLRLGADANVQNSKGLTPLHSAVGRENYEMVKLLLRYNADPNIRESEKGNTPFYVAVKSKCLDLVELLLDYGADANAANKNGILPIHVAAHALDKDLVKILLSHGAYYNAESKGSSTPLKFAMVAKDAKLITMLELNNKLFSAIARNDSYQIECCVQAGAILNARNIDGVTALYMAVHSGNSNIVNLMLKHKANVELGTNKGNPLLIAVASGNEDLIHMLLKHVNKLEPIKNNRIINATTSQGSSAVQIATELNNMQVVQLLLQNGAIFNIQDKNNKTPLSSAKDKSIEDLFKSLESLFEIVKDCSDSVEEISRILKKNKSVLNARDVSGGGTLLYWSISKDLAAIAKFLLKQGADYCLVTNKGTSPLHIAASKGNLEVVKAIVANAIGSSPGAARGIVNAVTVNGTAPLHVASNKRIVSCLLQTGAIYNIRNRENKTALEITQDEDTKKLLQTTHQIFVSMKTGDFQVMNILNGLKPDDLNAVIGARNAESQTLLQVAEANGHKKIARRLEQKIKGLKA